MAASAAAHPGTLRSGTYLRALARDLGKVLGSGGYLAGLRRTATGSFREDHAVPLASLCRDCWRSPEELLAGAERLEIDVDSEWRLSRGQRVAISGDPLESGEPLPEGRKVAWCGGRVVGLVEVRGELLYPRRWLARSADS